MKRIQLNQQVTSLETKVIRKEAEIDRLKTTYSSQNDDNEAKMEELQKKLKQAENKFKMKDQELRDQTDQNTVVHNE